MLRGEGVLDALIDALEGIDRLVLLGDALELRHRPAGEVLESVTPLLRTLGEALGSRQLVILAGNHDHALIERWQAHHEGPLGLDQRFGAEQASGIATALAQRLGSVRLEFAYPGIWLREDVYATHGHYLDLHITVPTFERLAVAASGRVALDRARRWNDPRSPDDYEAVLAPVYAWLHAAAQTGRPGPVVNGGGTLRAWRALGSGGGGGARSRALATAFPLAVGALNAAGFGPFRAELSSEALRSAGLRAMSEVVERLRIRARHVIFGHTHRAGMLDGDERAQWLTPNGVQLHNTGSWVYSESFLATADPKSPYWPGNAVLLDDGAPPQLLRLLADQPATALSPNPLRRAPR